MKRPGFLSLKRTPNPNGPPVPHQTPMGQAGQPCQIVFGSNTDIQKVLMEFSAAATRLIFSPDEARDVATKLTLYADLAEGKKVS